MSRVILYHATLPDRLAPAASAALVERLAYARRVTLPVRREDRDASLAGIALALVAVGEARGRAVPPEALQFPAGRKPCLASPGAPEFSISHSGGEVVAAACEGGALGVDLECAEVSRLDEATREAWSAREAVVKALGLGLRAAPEVRLGHGEAHCRGHRLHLTRVALAGQACWVASAGPVHDVVVRHVDVGELVRRLATT